MDAVIIRQALEEDAAQIVGLMKELAVEPDINLSYTLQEADAPIEKERERIVGLYGSLCLVAEVQGRIVGELTCTKDPWTMTGHVAYLGMSIHKDFRNKGLGSMILRKAIEWAKETGIIKRIELEVFARNAPAIHLYEKFGFEIEGEKRRNVHKCGEYLDSLIMALHL